MVQLFLEMTKLFANSGDPDQMLQNAASNLGLHCLSITLKICPQDKALQAHLHIDRNCKMKMSMTLNYQSLKYPSAIDLFCWYQFTYV